MLHEEPFRYNSLDGTGIGADAGSGEWTGEKRRKPLGPSLHSVVPCSSSDSPPATEYQEDPFFMTADLKNFIVDFDEVMRITAWMKGPIFVDRRCTLDGEEQLAVYERLVLYRLKAHKLSKGEAIDNDETLKKELPDFLGKETEHPFQLHDDVDKYFKFLEENEVRPVGWYFDPEFSELKGLTDYQRLVLKNHGDVEYLDWEGYRTKFSTYEMDKDYVVFFTEISKKLQWMKEYSGIDESSYEWLEQETIGSHQALKIAAKSYPGLTVDLAFTACREHFWSLSYDYWFREDWDTIFFEIWELVTHDSLNFTHALRQVIAKHVVSEDKIRQRKIYILRFQGRTSLFDLKSKFASCVQDIPHNAADELAKELIKKAVWKLPKKKMLHEYINNKMSIAREIGLDED